MLGFKTPLEIAFSKSMDEQKSSNGVNIFFEIDSLVSSSISNLSIDSQISLSLALIIFKISVSLYSKLSSFLTKECLSSICINLLINSLNESSLHSISSSLVKLIVALS